MSGRVLLFSGGLDSLIHWRLLSQDGGPPPKAVYYCLGHRYQAREIDAIQQLEWAAQSIGIPLHVEMREDIQLGHLADQEDHIPYRNLILATMALAHFDPDLVYLGALRGEMSRDKSAKFFKDATKLLRYTENNRHRILAPYKHLTKTQLVALYRLHHRTADDLTLIKMTRSCYADDSTDLEKIGHDVVGCGECNACFRRWVAMTNNGIVEQYVDDPTTVAEQHSFAELAHRFVFGADPREWRGILANNQDAATALWAYRERMKRG